MSVPFLPLYVTDYEADTAHLSIEEDGAYMRLLRLCWRTPGCSIPSDPAWLKRMLRMTDEQFDRHAKPVLSEFFVIEKGRYVQHRLLREYDKAMQTRRARKESGSRGGKVKALKTNEMTPSKCSSKTVANLKHLELELELYNSDPYGSDAERVEPPLAEVEPVVAEEPVVDLSRIIWGRWIKWLVETGVAEKHARSFIGKMRQVATDRDICDAFEEAQAGGVVDPVPWLRKRLDKPVVDLNKIMGELQHEWTAQR